jgi:hypothetical protein
MATTENKPKKTYGYAISYQCEHMVGCIQAANRSEARQILRTAFRLPTSVEISLYEEKYSDSGIWEIYYGS